MSSAAKEGPPSKDPSALHHHTVSEVPYASREGIRALSRQVLAPGTGDIP